MWLYFILAVIPPITVLWISFRSHQKQSRESHSEDSRYYYEGMLIDEREIMAVLISNQNGKSTHLYNIVIYSIY